MWEPYDALCTSHFKNRLSKKLLFIAVEACPFVSDFYKSSVMKELLITIWFICNIFLLLVSSFFSVFSLKKLAFYCCWSLLICFIINLISQKNSWCLGNEAWSFLMWSLECFIEVTLVLQKSWFMCDGLHSCSCSPNFKGHCVSPQLKVGYLLDLIY